MAFAIVLAINAAPIQLLVAIVSRVWVSAYAVSHVRQGMPGPFCFELAPRFTAGIKQPAAVA